MRQILNIKVLFLLILTATLLSQPACHESTDNPTSATDWHIESPADHGLDPATLASLTTDIEVGEFDEIHSLLIVRDGVLVYEEYFRGYDPDDLHVLYSVTKSVAATLIGIALEEGAINSVDDKLLDLFPEYTVINNLNADKQAITLAHVLQMRAGFEWNEWSTPYTSPDNPVMNLASSSDWIQFVLDLPMANPPGSHYTYNSGCSVLLTGLIRNHTGQTAAAYAEDKLFEPLGISEYIWQMGPNGVNNGGWGLSLKPRDMARIGYLYLQNGEWNDERILSPDWIEASWTAYSEFGAGRGYGYQWWQMPDPQHLGQMIYYGHGFQGQFIFVLPHLDMVIVSTANNPDNPLANMRTMMFERIMAGMVR